VGIARHDGEVGANKAIEFVKNAPESDTMSAGEIQARLEAKGMHVVTKLDLALLMRAEQRALESGPASPRGFVDNEAMFQAIDRERELQQTSTSEGDRLVPTG
jgi:hypothetical protein